MVNFLSNRLLLLGLLILFSSPFFLNASHLVGGKITYRYLGANKYEYKLTVYRDCSDQVGFNDPATIHIYDKSNNNLVYIRNAKLTNKSIVPPFTPNPCFVPPSGICVEIGNYVDTVMLNPNLSGYAITHQNCCHNGSVLNIISPQTTGMAITTDIPPQINNSPQFINFPPIYICQSDTFNYSFAATDADGDNLIYQFCTPYKDGSINYSGPFIPTPPPYNNLLWGSGFSVTNPLSNNGGITLNSSTGQLKFKPNITGQYAIGICVLEYRNNILINTNRVELQFNIVNCYLVSSIPMATDLCEGLTINFQNNSANANSFHWNFGDPSTLADTSNLLMPTYTFPNYGTYTVSLVAQNTAYGICKDTSKKVINVNPLLSPTLPSTYSDCFKNNNINFNVGGSYHPSATFNWHFTNNSTSPNLNINPATAQFTTPSPKTVSVVINQFGCKDTLFASVSFTNPTPNILTENIDCIGLTPFFVSISSNATNVFWNFGDPFSSSDTSSQISPTYTYSSYGNYTLSLIAYQGTCSDTLKVPVNIKPRLVLLPDNVVQKQCFKNNSFNFSANGIFSYSAVVNWSLTNSPNPITLYSQNPINVHFDNPGLHKFLVTVSENGCTRSWLGNAIVKPNPKATALLSDSIVCMPSTIKFKSISDSLHPIQNYWNINNTTFTNTNVNYTFNNAGLYSYSLVVRDSNNCTDTINKKNFIKINPKPIVKSFANPFYTSILDPKITFIDSTVLNHSTSYNFGDGATSTNTLNSYSYQSAGEFQYSLIVTSTFGCADTANGTIFIDDIGSNYVPNIFSPNDDGVNDVFFIKGKNITSSSMQIFNRWGALVCNSSNALIGWNGINQNNNSIADDGTYFYIIELTLGNNRSYKFDGYLQLVR